MLALCMTAGLFAALPLTAWADSSGADIDMSDYSPPTSGTNWTYNNNVYTLSNNANVTVIGTGPNYRRIAVAEGAAATITLNGADIGATYELNNSQAAITLGSGANVNLILTGDSYLTGRSRAGIQTTGATLTISGSGSLTAQGGEYSAGIGGTGTNAGGAVTISGGTVMATGGAGGAGIGGGDRSAGGTITISGGTVTAIGGNSPSVNDYWGGAAGIGGGAGDIVSSSGASGDITIMGGAQVTATGGNSTNQSGGAGIGSGGAGSTGGVGALGTINIDKDCIIIATGGIGTAWRGADIGYGGGDTSVSQNAGTELTAFTPSYSITLSETGTHPFTGAAVGYTAQTGRTITVTNAGLAPTGGLTVALSDTNAGSFTLSKASIGSIAAGGMDTFTVTPATGLGVGTHTATVTVSNSGNGITANFAVSFTVSALPPVPVNSIDVTSSGNSITTYGGTMQMAADILPANATVKTVTWSIASGSGANVSNSGLLTATADGSVTVRATANDSSGVYGEKAITISGQTAPPVPVISIAVTSSGNSITTNGGTMQMAVDILPANATVQTVTWSIASGSGANVSNSGLLTATADGSVTVRATSNDGSGVYGEKTIAISGQTAPPSGNTAPTINGEQTGTDSIELTVGYADYTETYTIAGTPAPTVTIEANTAGATFAGNTLTIPLGLSAGAYSTTIKATNSEGTATRTVAVNVSDSEFTYTQDPITDTATDAVFKINGNFMDLYGVAINGQPLTLDKTDPAIIFLSGYPGYGGTLGDAVEGSVVITLYKEFLATLPNDSYTLTAAFTQGGAPDTPYSSPGTTFVIDRPTEAPYSPAPATSSGDSGSGGADYIVPASTSTWIDAAKAKNLLATAQKNGLNYVRTSGINSYGIRAAALKLLGDIRFYHDTLLDKAVAVRVTLSRPDAATKDLLLSGYIKGAAVDSTKAKFAKWFTNKTAVIHLEQQEPWGQSVEIAAKVDLSGMDTKSLVFYAYDKKTNTYKRIPAPKYWTDTNGYLHFTTELAGDIIITDKPLIKQ
ncbi:hypothetical protein FACS1894191_7290 [Clostridia bacterium]|nr:hypothetical protein FACS1894191_7290 [Clostridia bacterium]